MTKFTTFLATAAIALTAGMAAADDLTFDLGSTNDGNVSNEGANLAVWVLGGETATQANLAKGADASFSMEDAVIANIDVATPFGPPCACAPDADIVIKLDADNTGNTSNRGLNVAGVLAAGEDAAQVNDAGGASVSFRMKRAAIGNFDG